jgi:hypothetical protein
VWTCYSLRMPETRVLSRTCGPCREHVRGGSRWKHAYHVLFTKWILKNHGASLWNRFICFGTGAIVTSCEQGNGSPRVYWLASEERDCSMKFVSQELLSQCRMFKGRRHIEFGA